MSRARSPRSAFLVMMVMRRWGPLVFGACFVLPFFLLHFLLPSSPAMPQRLLHPAPDSISCDHPGPPLTLGLHAFCTGSCGEGSCFPRVSSGVCMSESEVRVCTPQLDDTAELPPFMRFHGEKLTVPVVWGKCMRGSGTWIRGVSMVADHRLLPHKKPNPHHEAEKLVPATLLVHKLGLSDAKLYWFSSEDEVSSWAKGFLEAVGMKDKVEYLELPKGHQGPICFQDAILFSAPTNVRYVPSEEHNAWLRTRVLQHCSIPIVNETSTLKEAVIVDRSGPRHLANKDQIFMLLARVLKVPVRIEVIGGGSFCEQVSKVAMEDFLVVPHGSQNVNLLFARPGAQIIEVFPYLFYNTALRNYTHAAQLHVYPLLGTVPPYNLLMHFFSLLGWDLCYDKVRWCKNYSRRQPIYANLAHLERLLTWISALTYNFVD